jgi:hypothetical protein
MDFFSKYNKYIKKTKNLYGGSEKYTSKSVPELKAEIKARGAKWEDKGFSDKQNFIDYLVYLDEQLAPGGGGGGGGAEAAAAIEATIRRKAVESITRFYNIINRKFRYPRKNEKQSWKYIYPGWYREPIDPIKLNTNLPLIPTATRVQENHYFVYQRFKSYPIPLFNTPLEYCLEFPSIQDNLGVTAPTMECTAAFGMAQIAILYNNDPEEFKTLFDISILDKLRAISISRGKNLVPGYDRRLEVTFLYNSIRNGLLTKLELTSLSMNNILLNMEKAQRLLTSSHFVDQNFLSTQSSEVKLGDGVYIYGHPEYKGMGPFTGEHVYCVDFREGEPYFIGFQGLDYDGFVDITGISTPQSLSHIRRCLAIEYIKSTNHGINHEGIEQLLPKILSELPRSINVISALNIKQLNHTNNYGKREPVSQGAIDSQQSDITSAQLLALIEEKEMELIRKEITEHIVPEKYNNVQLTRVNGCVRVTFTRLKDGAVIVIDFPENYYVKNPIITINGDNINFGGTNAKSVWDVINLRLG